eukprot:TRINITY_DN9939_c0_g1_i1.p1 TRINITY_DN9939_c0_g1~~TRINITY_DN9939_c0_g1_i1.p1  ORF type:complete len:145 (-),score=76.64 TRINITY_DN9939_c0_g1_i1:67-501(-)
MSSGVAIHDECVEAYNSLKLGHQFRHVVFKISDNLKEIVVEEKKTNDKGEDFKTGYDAFVASLPKDECRYAVYDFDFKAEDGGDRSKIVFILWAPDSAKTKPKMMYTSSKDALRKKLVGIGAEVQATDLAEVDHSAVLEKCLRK